jgi:transposase
VLTQEQIAFIAQKLPSPQATTGRPAYTNQELLPGILRVLRSGCRWRDLNLPGYPDGSTHWRRLRLWRKGVHFRNLWKNVLKLLAENDTALQTKHDHLKRVCIDGTLLQSFEFKEKTGYSGKHKRVGVKASILVDATGIPLAVTLATGNVHDVSLAESTIERFHVPTFFGTTILADRGYDSRRFRRLAYNHGMKPYVPKRSYTKERARDFHLYRYDKEEGKNRFIVERTNAWFKSFRRLRNRFDYTAASFEAFLYLAILVICVRRLVL